MNVLVIALDAETVDLGDAEVLVVAPAVNSRLRHWLSDEDGARHGMPKNAWRRTSTGWSVRARMCTAASATPIRCRRSQMRS